jgi:outer membrane protein TolC
VPRASLAVSLDSLDAQLPSVAANDPPHRINVDQPLGIADIGLLAVLNDPDLQSEWGEMRIAQAGLLQASLLPNPSVGLGFAALLGGPGSAPSYTASLSQDVAAFVTYHARVRAARAHVSEVNASLLWQEWQVAQQARLLALDLYYGNRSIALTRRELDLVSDELTQAQAATAAGNLALAALAPLLAAKASAEQALVTFDTNQIRQWQSLDALLGLEPNVRFAIAAPDLPPTPPELDPLIARLPEARPDLIALQLGYRSSEATVRAAILGQFPAFVFGGSWTSDTSQVRSAGPAATFDLPIFNRNQGQISQTRATRLLLREQYTARLDSAVGTVRGLAAQERRLTEDLRRARQAAASAEALARTARAAYTQGNLDQRSLTDYETTALQRALEVADLERAIGEDEITLSVELGIGLPAARIAPPDRNTLQ